MQKPSTLLIDIGNSRVKWAVLRDGRLGRQQVGDLSELRTLRFAPLLHHARRAASVVAVCVAGAGVERELRSALRAARAPQVRFARSAASTAGLRNGYREPWRLGADRWIAAIGAWHCAGGGRPVCVIDIGTAATVDIVDAKGRHQGGLIVPGPALMARALLRGTKGIAQRAHGLRPATRGTLAKDTATAIAAGARMATLAVIEKSTAIARKRHGPSLRIYVTGGGALDLRGQLPRSCHYQPDLVLRGLAVVSQTI